MNSVAGMLNSAAGIGQRVGAICLNTVREAVRNRVLGVLVMFAVGLMAFSIALGEMSLHEEVRIIKDLGLAGISIVGLIISLFLGVNLLSKELDRKTVYAMIPKPIARWEFLLGKLCGLIATMVGLVTLMSFVLWLFVVMQGGHHGELMLRAEILVASELVLVTGVALFFSSFSSPYLSAMFTGALWVIGRNSAELSIFTGKRLADTPLGPVLEWIVRAMPDFRMFYISGANLDGDMVSIHSTFVTWAYVGHAVGYCVLYTAFCFGLAVVLFSRRDLV